MKRHGYDGLPAHCFWKDSIADIAPAEIDPVVRTKFTLSPQDKIATAGSCFAQHISNFLCGTGFHFLVTESAHPLFADQAPAFNYGVFTARYGNVYTPRQWLQLLQRAYGAFTPAESFWPGKDGRALDPFRPAIQPRGFSSPAEAEADRRQHFAAVRRAVEELDVFVFTLGLTEAWVCRESGAVYPVCPGVVGGAFDESRHVFENFGVAETFADLNAAIAFVRARNPGARFILTVSPVPLIATALDRSALVSTTYSKSVLRVAAEEAAALRNDPRFPHAHFGLATLGRVAPACLAVMDARTRYPHALGASGRLYLICTLARAYDEAGDTERAFAAAQAGAGLRSARGRGDAAGERVRLVPAAPRPLSGADDPTDRLAFVFGPPRSGTTCSNRFWRATETSPRLARPSFSRHLPGRAGDG